MTLRLLLGGRSDDPLPTTGLCGGGTSPAAHPTDMATAVRALLTVERLRVRAADLRAGDVVLHLRGPVISVATVAAVTGWPLPGAGGSLTVTTENGGRWTCTPDDRSFLRVTA